MTAAGKGRDNVEKSCPAIYLMLKFELTSLSLSFGFRIFFLCRDEDREGARIKMTLFVFNRFDDDKLICRPVALP